MARTSDKRERLIRAGRDLMHRHGFARTTLADISRASGVPLGNVYYHFHTKESLLEAVAGELCDDFRLRAARFERDPDPKSRLLAFLDSVIEGRRMFAELGCPVGSLSQELNKLPEGGRDKINEALDLRVQWAAEQFRLMGRSDARELGECLVASIQGAILMANALRDPGLITRQMTWLKAWISAI